MSSSNFGRPPMVSQQSNSRAFVASRSDSNKAYMSDLGSTQGTHYNHFSQPIDYNTSLSQPSFQDPA